MKKSKWIHWLVALCLVGLVGYSAFHVHRAEVKNEQKMAKQAKLDKAQKAKQKALLAEQKKNMQVPISWEKPSELLAYPDVSKAVKSKNKATKIWLLVSQDKQRVYVRQGPYTLYTMYASMAKNYEGTKNYQETPVGTFKLQAKRGDSYYDATKGYGAKYWTSFLGNGAYRFESVPFSEDGNVILSQAKLLGQKVTKKKNVNAYGSIRLSVSDAKWIMENLPKGTQVIIQGSGQKDDPWETMKD
ncbi:L,D-transpeptidase [Ligilactobacillus apodemi]|uniref:ErfK family protein n=1 Tax=Ligilactobacillus apodemi DSM 16634 = JCM 16172 TaxID=1423724 RepID=A0A0R1U5L4_9LACO|nr:L,D-transpeptidase [Ligilactobacillus apodemi]KRL85131.1 ErfK family protein [Ligilactobacillus apodemi DSM 16634 = JCM 16172]MCR1902109.1 L,D-transpeptidase [Ligilactobacillus apodemi]